MAIAPLTSKIVSTLGNKDALTPLLFKDTVTSWAIVQNSKKQGGEIEGEDRFIDEYGTLAIWLGGIPFFKKIIDKTLYKKAKIDPNVDIRVLNSKSHKEFAQKYVQGEAKEAFGFALKNNKTAKRLFYTKFGLATGLTIAAYAALTKIRHNITQKKSEAKVYREYANAQFSKNLIQENTKLKFSALQNVENKQKANNSDNISFGSAGKVLQSFMFNPAQNTSIIDASILGMRLGTSRPDGDSKKVLTPERAEYLAKDLFILFFYYAFGGLVQPYLDKGLAKITKRPIDLDARALDSKELTASLQNKDALKADLKSFAEIAGDDAKVLEFLQHNPDSIITQTAKISDVVATVQPEKKGGIFVNMFKGLSNADKVKAAIDPTKYIDVKEIKNIAEGIQKLSVAADGKNIEKFIKQAKGTKIGSILGGMGICLFALGYVMPKFAYGYVRKKMNHGSTSFHVQENIERECRRKMAMNMK